MECCLLVGSMSFEIIVFFSIRANYSKEPAVRRMSNNISQDQCNGKVVFLTSLC